MKNSTSISVFSSSLDNKQVEDDYSTTARVPKRNLRGSRGGIAHETDGGRDSTGKKESQIAHFKKSVGERIEIFLNGCNTNKSGSRVSITSAFPSMARLINISSV